MRVATAGKKKFRQRDDGNILLTGRLQIIQRAGAGRQNPGASIDLFRAQSSRASEDKLMIGPAKSVIGRILGESSAIIRLRTNITGGNKAIQREVLPFGTFQGVVTLVAYERESRTAYVSR